MTDEREEIRFERKIHEVIKEAKLSDEAICEILTSIIDWHSSTIPHDEYK